MPFSPPDPIRLMHRAGQALGTAATACAAARPGGNNRLYRLETAAGPVALKLYPRAEGDGRDRLGAERAAAVFLAGQGETAIPRFLAAAEDLGFSLFTWVEGEAVTAAGPAEVDQALAFLERLHRWRSAPAAAALPPASEACLSEAELRAQLRHRFERLAQVEDAGLRSFLAARIAPRLVGPDGAGADLPRHVQTLSPSDFGFHNALRRPDGGLVFLDFEYFGWDDPVKLTADILLHPGMDLAPAARARFLAGCAGLYGAEDGDFSARLRRFYPLYGLRWCLILLNEFLPERWARRHWAGAADRDRARHRQLAKAEAMAARLSDAIEPP